MDCLKQKTLHVMPVDIEEWMDREDDNTMFSTSIVEKGISTWECSHCPWWLEYPLGVVPKSERELYASKHVCHK